MRRLPEPTVRSQTSLIEEASETCKLSAVCALFSGGHDSCSATHAAMESGRCDFVAHIDTGIGLPETQEYVREVCKAQGWPLKVYRAVDQGQKYEDLVLEQGFPGPAQHRKMYNRLKERSLRQIVRDHKTQFSRERVLFVTGVRSQESRRRMGYVEPIQSDGVVRWVAINHHFSAFDVNDYMEANGLPRNPVKDLIHKSGECLCGAFAKPGELAELELWFPKMAERIRGLEKRAEAAGVHCEWGKRPPRRFQLERLGQMPLCFSCEAEEPDHA